MRALAGTILRVTVLFGTKSFLNPHPKPSSQNPDLLSHELSVVGGVLEADRSLYSAGAGISLSRNSPDESSPFFGGSKGTLFWPGGV